MAKPHTSLHSNFVSSQARIKLKFLKSQSLEYFGKRYKTKTHLATKNILQYKDLFTSEPKEFVYQTKKSAMKVFREKTKHFKY